MLLLFALPAFSHGVAAGDADYIQRISGMALIPYMYLGAKHMFTGYDHLLFLAGVIFFLYKMIEYPLKSMNYQLNEALKAGTSNIEVDYDFPVLENLASNISSSLSRSGNDQAPGVMGGFEPDRTLERSVTHRAHQLRYQSNVSSG